MVWYGMVNVDLYSAIITKVSNALGTLVSGEKPGFVVGRGRFFDTGDASSTPPLFWTEIHATVSPLLQLATY